ncbi:hypothetical protein [Flavobacterium sp. CS20]|jgi:hypothetical protein|uniref:hypothetical protein n=1 Tax=Flavobacterium sp. CS20 TaxID=2775246 RepID=UPI001B3A65C4|nr:hypothetical protein [Flavobacterium sp. CS20]QTY25922.1 hypothetical protein IGB25_07780 [Flavobacterium sp. CS20]
MQNSEDPFVKKWKKVREKGLKKYLISTGLSFGILLFVVLTAWNYFVSEQAYETTSIFLVQLVITIVFGGGLYALITWHLNEYIYKKKTKS